MRITDLIHADLVNNYTPAQLKVLAKYHFNDDILNDDVIRNIAVVHSSTVRLNNARANMLGGGDYLEGYHTNVRAFFNLPKSQLLIQAMEKGCRDLVDLILKRYSKDLSAADTRRATQWLSKQLPRQPRPQPSKQLQPQPHPSKQPGCELKRVCPQGYKLAELRDIAKKCGIDSTGLAKKDLCNAIRKASGVEPTSGAYNVHEKGVMLAEEYISKRTGRPIIDPTGYLASEKFDGVRAIWDGKNFVSRTGKVYAAPEWFKDLMPNNVLDGELFIGRDRFQETVSTVRKKKPVNSEWQRIKYNVFDVPTSTGTAEERIREYTEIVKAACAGKKDCKLYATPQKRVTSEADLSRQYNLILAQGGEGMMLRKPGSSYVGKRSRDLLKYKPTFDAEAEIIDYESGTGKYTGLLGALVVKDLNSGKRFKIGSGLTDEIRTSYKTTHPRGTIVTYKYTGFTDSGVPRHPRYFRIR